MSPRTRTGVPLSRERIVAAAIEVADEHGLDALSMRRVADQVGSGAMSLYRHVADKDELVAAMVDRVIAARAYPDPGDLTWRQRLHVLARHDWSAFLDHPWLLAATTTTTPPFGTASLAAMEWALDALEPLGLPPDEAGRAIMTVNNYVQGSARVVLGEREADADDADPGRAWQRRLHDVDLEAFPHLARLVAHPLPARDRDWFEDGLDVILDGVQSRARTPAP